MHQKIKIKKYYIKTTHKKHGRLYAGHFFVGAQKKDVEGNEVINRISLKLIIYAYHQCTTP